MLARRTHGAAGGGAPARGQPLTAAASWPPMKCRWKAKNTIATGIVDRSAAPSVSGYCVPAPSCPLENFASPVVSVLYFGSDVDTRNSWNSFHEPWKLRIVSVISPGLAIGRITDQYVRKT